MDKDALRRLLVAAQHQDTIRSWPWIGRVVHWLFASWRCPACKLWNRGAW